MRLLLTSAGVTNGSIHEALVDLLGKPVAESKAVCVPTAVHALPGGSGYAWQLLRELGGMGWQEFGVLELTALPTLEEGHWLPAVEAADAVIVGGGNGGYLSHWFQQSGLAERFPALLEDRVYVGISAGSAMATPGLNYDPGRLERTGLYYDDEYGEAALPNAGSARGMGLVDFAIHPHLNAEYFPAATTDMMERAAAKLDCPMYAIDDQTAIKVVDGEVEVVSEGE